MRLPRLPAAYRSAYLKAFGAALGPLSEASRYGPEDYASEPAEYAAFRKAFEDAAELLQPLFAHPLVVRYCPPGKELDWPTFYLAEFRSPMWRWQAPRQKALAILYPPSIGAKHPRYYMAVWDVDRMERIVRAVWLRCGQDMALHIPARNLLQENVTVTGFGE